MTAASAPGGDRPILLLGRTGQLGRALAVALAPLGSVVALGRDEMDLADAEAIRRVVRAHGPAMIVNAAGYTAVDEAEEQPELAMAVNGKAPGILAEEAKHLDVPLVHYSTDYVFDGAGVTGPNGTPRSYVEDDPPAPLNAYGRSKLAGEIAIAAAAPVHLILRTSWLYSSHGRNFLNTVRQMANRRDELRIVSDQIGCPTWTGAVADATVRILTTHWRPEAGRPGLAQCSGLYHLAAGGAASWYDFAREIVARSGLTGVRVSPIPSRDYPTRARRPAMSVLDCSKLAAAFGIRLADWCDQLNACLAVERRETADRG